MPEEIRQIVCEEMKRQSENCMMIFIKKPTWIGVVLTVLVVIGAAAGWTAFAMDHEKRIVTVEQKIEFIERTVNSKLDMILERLPSGHNRN